eukprot:TRINITY_DN78019_c0_g1_i1.p1 TRINITY_DN78019_c0_g1~~TRINITY_DN78019_c0_g1_i1.p1  ORF type:complete len:650 (-),score=121.41 TRINITY_DN78019_c0_g1_i1:5295-7244(-)
MSFVTPAFAPAQAVTASRSFFGAKAVSARCSRNVTLRMSVRGNSANQSTKLAKIALPASDVSRPADATRVQEKPVANVMPATTGMGAFDPRISSTFTVVVATIAGIIFSRRKRDENKDLEKLVGSPLAMSGATAGNGSSAPKSLGQRLKGLIPPENERKKLFPLGLMFFVILFNYTILRDTKDVLVVTSAGAEIIPFLKTYCNLPGAILFTIGYSNMSNALSREQLFYVCIVPFVLFFLAFGFFIYPNLGVLHPVQFANSLAASLPPGFVAPIAILKNWTFALFYTLAELWGSVVVSLLFWGFANEVTTVDEAKKYYPLFGLMANVALIFSGQYVRFVSDIRAKLPPGVDGWALSLKYLMSMIGVGGAVIVACYYYMQRKVLTDPNLFEPRKQKSSKQKTKLGLVESAKYLGQSKYIRDLATLVIAYGMSINIVEVTWKSRLRAAYPDPNAYSAFMGNFSTCTGIVTFTMMIVGRFIFRKFGWGAAAVITPLVLGITGLIFFSLILFSGTVSPFIAALGTTPLIAAVMIGAAQNILSKSSKYSLFDPCKEMAYIPLDVEQKSKGKAAIDVIGNPLGKSGGSFIQQILIFSMGSLAASTPYLAVILFAIIGMWLAAARSLDKQFSEYMMKETAPAAEKKVGAETAAAAAE